MNSSFEETNTVRFDLFWMPQGISEDLCQYKDGHFDSEIDKEIREILGCFSCQTWPQDRTVLMCTFSASDPNVQTIYEHFKWKESALLYAVDKLFSILGADPYKRYKYLELEYDNKENNVLICLRPPPNAEKSVVELYKIIYFALYYHIQIRLVIPKRNDRATGVRRSSPQQPPFIFTMPTKSSEPEPIDMDGVDGQEGENIGGDKENIEHESINNCTSVWSEMLTHREIDDEVVSYDNEKLEKSIHSLSSPAVLERQVDEDEMGSSKKPKSELNVSVSESNEYSDESCIDSEVESLETDTDSSLDDIAHELDNVTVLFQLKKDTLMGEIKSHEVFMKIDEILGECMIDPIELLVKTHNMEKMNNDKFLKTTGRPVPVHLLVGTIFQIIDNISTDSEEIPPFTHQTLSTLSFPHKEMDELNKMFYFIMFYLKYKKVSIYHIFKTYPQYAESLAKNLDTFSKTLSISHFNNLAKLIKEIIEKSMVHTLITN